MNRTVIYGVTVVFLATAGAAMAQEFNGCGQLVEGVECVLFQPDEGGLWVLDNRGNFRIGDRVRVIGTLDRQCITICQQGNGCIRGNSIDVCEPPVNCDAIRKTKAKCKDKRGSFRLKGVVKSNLDGGIELTLLLDGGRAQVAVTNNRGKAKAVWSDVPGGRHEVCIEQCEGQCASTDCS